MGPNGEVSVYRESLRRLLKDLEYYKTQKIVTYEELKNEIDEDNEEYIIRYKRQLHDEANAVFENTRKRVGEILEDFRDCLSKRGCAQDEETAQVIMDAEATLSEGLT